MDTDEIIRAAGGPSSVGRKLGIHHSTVIDWRKTGRVPVSHVAKLEEITGIPRHQLRPDIYAPPAPSALPDSAGEQAPSDPPYGSTEWVIARRRERPAVSIGSVDLLKAMYEDD